MPKLINLGNEMIKISADGKSIEYSTNKGSSFSRRGSCSSSNGTPLDLLEFKGELLLLTSTKLMYSTNKGSSFSSRCSMSSSNGEPQSLSDGGNEILLITSKKLMYSTNKGSSFSLRKNL